MNIDDIIDRGIVLYASEKTVKKNAGVEDLIKIIKKLRSPSGCPWDREQTREKMGYYLIEEAHEAKEAIDGGFPEKIREELGDLLVQLLPRCIQTRA